MTTNGPRPSAERIAAVTLTSAISSPAARGTVMRSTRPANQAAGSMTSASARMASTPKRQPNAVVTDWPIGAAASAPSDPAPVMMPSTMLRIAAGTAREAAACAMAEAVQAKAMPINTPAPMTTPIMPCAAASAARPAR